MTEIFDKQPFTKTKFDRLTIPFDTTPFKTNNENFKKLSQNRLLNYGHHPQ